jgi:16S rRNA (cytosine967-C5)-methyltransferase
MSRYYSYINTAKSIIKEFKGATPLHTYLKHFFSLEKKYGSRDRKTISALCYYYYRLGHGEKSMTIDERILIGVFLCEYKESKLLEELKPELNNNIALTLQEKLFMFSSFYSTSIFPWGDELSEGIEAGTFSLSFLIQPKLFLRIRPGKEWNVIRKLDDEAIHYEVISEACIAFENGSKLHEVLEINNEVVVQDYNSQRVGEMLELAFESMDCPECKLWDCCAASGGKSIMAYDLKPSIEITVSDVRPSILHNLQQRFQQAGIVRYQSFLADLRNIKESYFNIGDKKYDLVICDAPCTGSGTWSRTPEQLCFFEKEEILRFAELQKNIVGNVVPHLKQGGQLLYITCSVFKKENEEVVTYIQEKLHLKLIKAEMYKGYSLQADTLFAALFVKEHEHIV